MCTILLCPPAEAPVWKLAKDSITILNVAGDEKPGTIVFSECSMASEVCAIDPDGKGVTVESASVDSFMEVGG
jgi:hypothetical protein